jgi:hypothetical protein
MHAAISFENFRFSTLLKQRNDKIYEDANVIVSSIGL